MTDPVDNLPLGIRDLVRRILERQVAGGGERYQSSGDRSGREGQKEISRILQDAGVYKNDPRWQATINHGRTLYRGGASRPARMGATPVAGAALDEGPIYTKGPSFRARAEALARRFRVTELRVAHGTHGHLLDDLATEAGKNFMHAATLAAVEARAVRGKGVDRSRTLGNMLSSQALCFNLLAPLAHDSDGLALASEVFGPFIPGLARVRSIELEHTPSFDVFRDQSGKTGVDCDALIEFEDTEGRLAVLVIETKFVETSFSACGHRSKSQCPDDVSIGKDFSGCRYASQNRFAYWQRTAEADSVHLSIVDRPGCPFGGPLWQIWVNHTLAHAEASKRGAHRAVFAVCAPEDNEALQARTLLDRYRQLVTEPQTVVFIPLTQLLDRLVQICSARDGWRDWAGLLRKRYAAPTRGAPPTRDAARDAPPEVPRRREAVTPGHRRVVTWMGTSEFRELVAVHQAVLGDDATIYFRPTDKGLVRIALHPAAPCYVGFHAQADDEAHLFASGAAVPITDDLRAHWRSFQTWLPSVRRPSDEERGVIPWLRRALTNSLWLPDLGDGWVFLHQEWRFVDAAGSAKKPDVLAVHVPTGQLGIVEFKSSATELSLARTQVGEYAMLWDRDADELSPLFTELLQALGLAYGNEAAATAVVKADPAALFVGTASPTKAARIFRHAVDE